MAKLTSKQKYDVYMTLIEKGIVAFTTSVRWGAICFIGYRGFLAFENLAGEETTASIMISLLSDIKINEWFAYLIGALGAGYGFAERKLRQKKSQTMGKHTESLELRLDPNRSSSNLKKNGTTRKEDR